MRLFKNFALVFLFIGTLASCDGMDATYKEFIEEGPIVYIGKVDSLKAYAGRNQAMLEWQKLLDPRAKTAKIFWENRTKSTELQLTDKAGLTQVIVKDLAEGSYVFEVCKTVMQEKPRRSTDFIISKAMRNNILGVGTIFLAVLLGMIYYFDHSAQGMDVHNLTIFFTFFVMLQFWNLFNARVFGTTDSAFKGLSKSYGMELIVLAILVGQFLIVQFGGAVFRTEPLDWQTWLLIIGVSSTVLWVGELIRLVQRSIHK